MFFDATILATFILVVILLTVPRKYFLIPYILSACFIPTDQSALIFNLHFTPLRILIAIGFSLTILRNEQLKIEWNNFDKLVIAWIIVRTTVFLIQGVNTQILVFISGWLFNVIGTYWLFRIYIRSWTDILLLMRTFAFSCFMLGVFVFIEWNTHNNPFTILGTVTTDYRMGNYRCQGSFEHSILLGLFWATIFPMFIGFAGLGKYRRLFSSAAAMCLFIIPATASSSPILTLLAEIILLFFYNWRQYTHIFLLASGLVFITAHAVMTEPLLLLFRTLSVVPGSTGYQRYNILYQAMAHLNEWFLLGTRSTAHWGPGLSDIVNQYVREGVTGGLISLILFLIILYTALRNLLSLSLIYAQPRMRFLAWCIFVAVAGHCLSFFGVAYFGQMQTAWFMTLAIISFLSKFTGNVSYEKLA
jgi:hypothetical protein